MSTQHKPIGQTDNESLPFGDFLMFGVTHEQLSARLAGDGSKSISNLLDSVTSEVYRLGFFEGVFELYCVRYPNGVRLSVEPKDYVTQYLNCLNSLVFIRQTDTQRERMIRFLNAVARDLSCHLSKDELRDGYYPWAADRKARGQKCASLVVMSSMLLTVHQTP